MPAHLPSLVGLSTTQIATALGDIPNAKLRSKQISNQIYKQAQCEWDEMHDLPILLREQLKHQFKVQPLTVAAHRTSQDSVDKLLVHNGDNQVYECVLLPYPDRVSCCLSSQVGCPMGCTFCATGMGGFDRNLGVDEIVAQYLTLQRISPKRISHVVFMGMGEPLLNLKNLVASLRILHDEIGLSYRHITVSTVGLVPQIYELAECKIPIHLALSLHSPLDSVRDTLMPVNEKWPVKEVVEAMKAYQGTTGRKVTFEYLLINNVNDTEEQARALVPLLKGMPNVINLIPFNWVDTGFGFSRPTAQRVSRFRSILKSAGMNVTVRAERGHDISAACGQLAGQHTGKFARRAKSTIPLSSL
jgi:23S rRNA (adenine2503-C2)-methyltransferase